MKNIGLLVITVILISCGEEKKKSQINLGDYNNLGAFENIDDSLIKSQEIKESSPEEEIETTAIVEVSISGNDQMQFNKEKITVPGGSTVKLTLTHEGSLPENVMGHNVVILKEGVVVTDFIQEAMKFPKNNYVPKDSADVVAYTEIIGGGETVSIEFEAPEPGEYTFICSFPGHFVQMQGTFIVE